MASDKELIETHMAHVRESLHEIRNQMAGITLCTHEIHALKKEVVRLNELQKQVTQNSNDILKVRTIGGFMGTLFSIVITIIAVFKGK